MLANLLPGIRDVRAPLAAGYLWLLAAYVAFEPKFRGKPRGVWLTLSNLRHTFSTVGLGIAVSFAAYLVGAISWSTFGRRPSDQLVIPGGAVEVTRSSRERFARRVTALFRKLGGIVRPRNRLSYTGQQSARQIVRRYLTALEKAVTALLEDEAPLWQVMYAYDAKGGESARTKISSAGITEYLDSLADTFRSASSNMRYKRGWLDQRPWLGGDLAQAQAIADHEIEWTLMDQMGGELGLARTSLLGTHPEVFSEVDRLTAEGEFRVAVAPPMLGLAAALAWRGPSWSAALLVLAAAALHSTGRVQVTRGNDALVDAIRLGRANVPTLDRVEEATRGLVAKAASVQPAAGVSSAGP